MDRLTAQRISLFFLFSTLILVTSCSSVGTTRKGDTPLLQSDQSRSRVQLKQPCINLNTATVDELIKLPGIGDVLAKRITDYRETRGRFRRTEEIIIIEGLSERKYRAIADLICVE